MDGSVALAGIFLSLAVVTGGLWLIRRSLRKPSPVSSRAFWITSGGAAVFAAIPLGCLFFPVLLLVAVALFAVGLATISTGLKRRSPELPGDGPHPKEGGANLRVDLPAAVAHRDPHG
jgi:hypothetical protein